MALTPSDIHLFNEGTHYQLYDKLGARPAKMNGVEGWEFAVWAPNAELVSVVGDFNGWNREAHPMHPVESSGVWSTFVPNLHAGQIYKYFIRSRVNHYEVMKADPFAVHQETPSQTGSRLWRLDYNWNDEEWMRSRRSRNALDAPISIYEVHLGSWMRHPDNSMLTYRDIAPKLASYARNMNFTHVELMPVMEHPFYGSWGYQITGYFAPSSRMGTPQDFMFLIDHLHQNGIGVILDWVPSHFPSDEHGLSFFDGTHLFEYADPRKGFHPDWNSLIFNYARPEVKSFLISNALYWLDKYHVDGLRVDAVASMLYLDYSRKPGEWIPNEHGGRENLEAIAFLRALNTAVYEHSPDVQMIAEESTAFPGVSRPVYSGGLGFGMKWDMGWMHDTLQFMQLDPIYRKYHHHELTFRSVYAFSENFTLSLSHDEVVHGKGSLLSKMPGDEWQKRANLRLLYGYMCTLPGKKLLFMGSEWGQTSEWAHEGQLGWDLLQKPEHSGLQKWLQDLLQVYQSERSLFEVDFNQDGFEWLDVENAEENVLIYLRKAKDPRDHLLVACNFTPTPRLNYQVKVPHAGTWQELLNSDALAYGGSGVGNLGQVTSTQLAGPDDRALMELILPPLAVVLLKPQH